MLPYEEAISRASASVRRGSSAVLDAVAKTGQQTISIIPRIIPAKTGNILFLTGDTGGGSCSLTGGGLPETPQLVTGEVEYGHHRDCDSLGDVLVEVGILDKEAQ